jgi:hypothetical protein
VSGIPCTAVGGVCVAVFVLQKSPLQQAHSERSVEMWRDVARLSACGVSIMVSAGGAILAKLEKHNRELDALMVLATKSRGQMGMEETHSVRKPAKSKKVRRLSGPCAFMLCFAFLASLPAWKSICGTAKSLCRCPRNCVLVPRPLLLHWTAKIVMWCAEKCSRADGSAGRGTPNVWHWKGEVPEDGNLGSGDFCIWSTQKACARSRGWQCRESRPGIRRTQCRCAILPLHHLMQCVAPTDAHFAYAIPVRKLRYGGAVLMCP